MSREDLAGRLCGALERARLAVDRETAERLVAYVALLFRWNERVNLTALEADGEGLNRLVVEPLLAALHIPAGSRTLVDIGSGGGSPAIPVRIARPELSLRMVESRTRKAAFLREAVRHLNLAGTVVESCRYEKLVEGSDVREAHDVLTVRGVRLDTQVAGELAGLVRPGGLMLAFCSKGGGPAQRDLPSVLRVEDRRALLEASASELIVVRKAAGKKEVARCR